MPMPPGASGAARGGRKPPCAGPAEHPGLESRDDRPPPDRPPAQPGQREVRRVIHEPQKIRYEDLLRAFWASHDPTQGMRQGNDAGTQYRSAIYVSDPTQRESAEGSQRAYQARLTAAGRGAITTEIRDAPEFFYAEDYHQQYLAKNPDGYCGIGGCGVPFKVAELQVEEKA